MTAKIAKFLKYFNFFGSYYEVANPTRRDFIAKRIFGFVWLVISIFFIFQGFHRGITSNHFSSIEYICQFVSHVFVQLFGLTTLYYSYKNLKRDHEIIDNFSEIHDLIESCLEIKIQYKKFYREVILRIFMQTLILFGTLTFKFFNRNEIYLFAITEYPEVFAGVVLGRVFFVKYLFMIDLMHFYMKVFLLIH